MPAAPTSSPWLTRLPEARNVPQKVDFWSKGAPGAAFGNWLNGREKQVPAGNLGM